MKNNALADGLRIFLAVIQEQGCRAVAKRLGTAPSKFSTTVTRIEADMDVPLLLRSTLRVEFTDHGRSLAA